MKTCIFYFLFLALCADSWAQLTCTNCALISAGGVSLQITAPGGPPITIPVQNNTFSGTIELRGACELKITGKGNYILSGRIRSNYGTATGSLTYLAPEAGEHGNEAGFTLTGSTSNDYTGQTILNSGYLICNKPNAVAVPQDLKISATAVGVSAHLWCKADNQFGSLPASVIDLTDGLSNSVFHLHGTTQTIAGIKGNNEKSVVENQDASHLPVGMAGEQTAGAAILNMSGASPACVIEGGAYIRKGATTHSLTVNLTGGTQIIRNPGAHIHHVILSSAGGATLELETATNTTLGKAITFKGNGIIKKTGAGTITADSTTFLTTGGKIWLAEGNLLHSKEFNKYSTATESNKASLQMGISDNSSCLVDIARTDVVFGGLSGSGRVYNSWGPVRNGAYCNFTLNQNDSEVPAIFTGAIDNNPTNAIVAAGNGTGGISLRKEGNGTQVLTGYNDYTGSTTVSAGKLKLQGGAVLGGGTYRATLEISNVAEEASQAVFEHNGTETQVFNDTITNTGAGTIKGIFLQSGTGKSIINGVNTFTGQVNVTGGVLAGSGRLKHVQGVSVGANSSIGGGDGGVVGDTLTVTGLTMAANSKLIVTSSSVTGTASLIDVKERGTDVQGTITVPLAVTVPAEAFTIDVLSANLVSSLIIKCTIAAPATLAPPRLGQNNTGRVVTFRWAADGLYMDLSTVLSGLACNNCTFTAANGQHFEGTSASPALILQSPGGTFTGGDITLTGDCHFTAIGAGNYTIPVRITSAAGSNFSLTCSASAAGEEGKAAGVTFSGTTANDYTGTTIINSGYLICNKTNNVVAVPHNLKVFAPHAGSKVHLWCKADNQFGGQSTVLDFSDSRSKAFLHLNGTTQTIAGIQSNNQDGVVENWTGDDRPVSMANEPPNKGAILNITGSSTRCEFGGGATISRGTTTHSLSVNVIGGTQVIHPTHVSNVAFSSTGQGILEFESSADINTIGTGVSFTGDGIIKKTGPGAMLTNNSEYLKTGGKLWVSEGEWRNLNTGNMYTKSTTINGNTTTINNKAMLQVDVNAKFDLRANNVIFSGLTGRGRVQNNYGGRETSSYSYLFITRDEAQTDEAIFEGVIANNSKDTLVAEGPGKGGIRLKKEGIGTQVLKGVNRYTGTTTIARGTLKLQGDGQLGGGDYTGRIELSNTSSTAVSTFEHNGEKTQVFNGPITVITGIRTIAGTPTAIFLQSGTGKSILNQTNDFPGRVNITAGFLGGSGSLLKVDSLTVRANGSIGGGEMAVRGGVLTVTKLKFAAASSKLVVTARPGNGMPSLVDVKGSGTSPGPITAATGFTVSLAGEALIASGYILKCSNGVSGGFAVPAVEGNTTGKTVTLTWDATGLYMDAGGVTCDNCSFIMPAGIASRSGVTSPGPNGGTRVTGNATNPASIPGAIFSGNITLNGPCNLTVNGIGNYTLSGQITGAGPLTYYAAAAGADGNLAGITLAGNSPNNYTGLTTVKTGFIVCQKANGVAAVPHDVKVSDPTGVTKIWFLSNNQLGNGNTVVDLTEAGANAFLHLNGTTQTVAGVKSTNNKVTLHSNKVNSYRPIGWSANAVKYNLPGNLNINATGHTYTLGGGTLIHKGFVGAVAHNAFAFTLNVTGGTQVIDVRNPVNIKQVTLASQGNSTLELNTGEEVLCQIGGGVVKNDSLIDVNEAVTLSGDGILKKTGTGAIALVNTVFLKSGGKIWVSAGTLRNEGTTIYANSTQSNKAVLEVAAAGESNNNPTFDIWGNPSIFGGLAGGGLVQNNWSAAAGATGGGYKNLTLNQDNTVNASVFNGIIRDNATSDPVSEGATGRGGISLKKEGKGVQALAGANLYTGSTTVSAGTLKLQEEGRLGKMNAGAHTGIYAGALEIANVAAAASQAIFEHNGSQTQVFNGSITNTGAGAVKGIFLQSGTGKSIINGVSTFTGQVRVTGGFLGGRADLRNTAGVIVGAQGSIGGGTGEAVKGDTLIVSNLTFEAASSKLIVASRLDNKSGLVEVRTSTGPGTITAANGLTVEILGNTLTSGYVLKCKGAARLPEPTLILPANSALTGRARLTWKDDGLWMQVSEGEITLGVVSSVCPKSNTGNPSITVKVTYSLESELPSSGSPDDYFSLSPAGAKSGPIRVTRIGKEITAEFDGSNTGAQDLIYTITYDDHKNTAITRTQQRINRMPAVSVSSGGNPTCIGVPLVLQATGNGVVTIYSADTDKATVGSTSSALSATATTTTAGNARFWATDINGCKSEYLTVVVNAGPVIRPENPSLCPGTSLTLTANQDPSPTSATSTSAWALSPATTTAALIEDENKTDKTGVFRANQATTTPTDIIVEYTSNLGCKGTTTVAIKTEMTLEHTATSPICSQVATDILLKPSVFSANYTWTVSENAVGAQNQTTPVSSPAISKVLSNNGGAPVSVTYSVTATAGTCTSASHDIIVQVSHVPRAIPSVTGGGQFCADPKNSKYKTILTPSVVGGATNVEWLFTSFYPENQAADVISGNTQRPAKAALGVLNDSLVLSGTTPASVYYVFRPYTTCLGAPETVRVGLNPAPVAVAGVDPSLCSGSAARIVLSSVSDSVAYTWRVDRTNSPGVTGYSEPAREGASVPTNNPRLAGPGPVEEKLNLSTTALKSQTIRYNITPWRRGCPGKAVPADITVYPLPAATATPSEGTICQGNPTDITLSNNLGEPEKYQVSYSWLATSSNITGAQSSTANQSIFGQQTLQINSNAVSGVATYSFTPWFTPVTGSAFSCEGQKGNAVYTVLRPPVAGAIDTAPVEVCLGDPLTISVPAPVPGSTYKWWKGDIDSGISGTTYVVPTTEASEVDYKVKVTNACSSIDSGVKKVKVTGDSYFTGGNAEAKAEKAEGFMNAPLNFTYTGPVAVFNWDFGDQAVSTDQNPSHAYATVASFNPKLKVEKPGQPACNKTFTLPELKIKEPPFAGDPNSSVALSVFPIPAHDRLTIVHDGDLKNLTISDVSGKKVMEQAVSGREAVLSIGHLGKGIYILTVTGSKGVQRLKISKN